MLLHLLGGACARRTVRCIMSLAALELGGKHLSLWLSGEYQPVFQFCLDFGQFFLDNSLSASKLTRRCQNALKTQ